MEIEGKSSEFQLPSKVFLPCLRTVKKEKKKLKRQYLYTKPLVAWLIIQISDKKCSLRHFFGFILVFCGAIFLWWTILSIFNMILSIFNREICQLKSFRM